ncbi:MAG: carbon monoxide dehydrogenase, partial [Rhodospirillaceae bacterium]|nr:carbon monoxide dehydrogenase [Rhodospirillaceae bacterium]
MYFGKPLLRREDARFLKGKGKYTDDLTLPGMTFAAFVRSTHAYATINSIDIIDAKAKPGVLAVFTSDDWRGDKMGELPCVHPMTSSDGRFMNEKLRPIFARDRVCHVGEVIACVIAETKNQALDGVEAVQVGYGALPANTVIGKSLDGDAIAIHPEFENNTVFEIDRGDAEATENAFKEAFHISEMTLLSNRVAGNPMEPRAFLADYEESAERYSLWCTSQIPHYFRRWLAKFVLFEAEHRIRVVSPDVGGGFGLKIHLNEGAIVTWATKKIGRPVKWTAT